MQKQITLLHWRLLFLLLIMYANIAEATKPATDQPPSVGNFALATSQEPGPFFSFGQNIVDKNQFILALNPGYLSSQSQQLLAGVPSLLYGITNSASVLLTIPYAFYYKNGNQKLSGIGDIELDLEYAFYNHGSAIYSDQATIVFSPSFPVSNLNQISKKHDSAMCTSGFSRKNASSSLNPISYFIGTTYSRTLTDWYSFIAPGILVIDKQHNIQQGNEYFYNFGLGHKIKTQEKKYIFFGLLELNGQYTNKTKLVDNIVPNTGGNIIFATPSLWFSTPKLIFQVGVSLPISQYWYGNQSNFSYYASGIVTWTMH